MELYHVRQRAKQDRADGAERRAAAAAAAAAAVAAEGRDDEDEEMEEGPAATGIQQQSQQCGNGDECLCLENAEPMDVEAG
ncbi:hypothetical protein ColTof4_05712 [Colletotrichum tofieldiae]|uniref:Uncharacterized protein n=1 Tax=Colletotrichum liriopes TaxID=708192 RepID=A0AA37LWK5_9PEZI|nr:hypothetical protein ColLi_09714 [Colletotrichum liriopes]GKT53536.1 hypothetical protein ColTof3_00875 [Colletotrichum tofieldiae]GKT73289.1 hypothetical protein ColTof4_05712 [Colletotrichum tofieldiae]GKT88038.1 hypothetical protein Ct61P_05888 [Colletotrichum tofieldiae]